MALRDEGGAERQVRPRERMRTCVVCRHLWFSCGNLQSFFGNAKSPLLECSLLHWVLKINYDDVITFRGKLLSAMRCPDFEMIDATLPMTIPRKRLV